MKPILTDEAFREQLAQEVLTIAVFKTTWCPDCHFIDPFMPEVESKYAEDVDFVLVDRDDLPDLCSELNILGIPSFIAFHKGKEVIRFVSKLRKSREEIEQFIDRAIAVSKQLQ